MAMGMMVLGLVIDFTSVCTLFVVFRLLRAPFVSLLVAILVHYDLLPLIANITVNIECLLLKVEYFLGLLGCEASLTKIDHLLQALRRQPTAEQSRIQVLPRLQVFLRRCNTRFLL